MKKIFKRLKMWIYWRNKYSYESFWFELAVLFGFKKSFAFSVMTPLDMFIDKMDKRRNKDEQRKDV